jgi:hypothetical protein
MLPCMKQRLTWLCLVLSFQVAQAQWVGVLTYTDNYDIGQIAGKTITTIYESTGRGRIDSKTYPTKSPNNDLAEKDQNELLFDFSKQQKTILIQNTKLAFTQALSTEDQRNQQVWQMQGGSVTIENLGSEKVGQFNCIHYAVTTTSTKTKMSASMPKKNIWITSDLGNSNIWYVGPYLYYIAGGFQQKKLADAGVTGVVVKWQYGDAEAILTGYQQGPVPASTFAVPSGYTAQ